MGNPRRVMIHTIRNIEQTWRATIERMVQLPDQTNKMARVNIDISFDADLAVMALAMLERVLRGEVEGFEPWDQGADDCYRYDSGGITLIYQPGSHQLHIEARLTDLISTEAHASAEANGFTVDEVAVEAVGYYYSDGWDGRTEQQALAKVRVESESRLAQSIEELHRLQYSSEFQSAVIEARMQAEQDADLLLERTRTEMRAAMRMRLQTILADAEDRLYHTLHRLVSETYRQCLIQLVRENGGRVLADERTGSILHLELELF